MSGETVMLRMPREIDRAPLLAIAVATERFVAAEAEALLGGVLDAYEGAELGAGHKILVACSNDGRTPVGWSYFAPDPFADRVWNLWWIGVHPDHQGSDAGRVLLRAVEAHVAQCEARVLVIETSDRNGLARARRFYEREGYKARGIIPDFYGTNGGKVIFSKSFVL